MTTNFRIGKGIGIVSEATIALFEPINGALAEALWAMVVDGVGIDELLEELSRTGLRSLGSFAMAQFEEAATRIVVRGSATARLRGPNGVRELGAQGVRTWLEEVVEGVTELDLVLSNYADHPLPFRINTGLVPADLLRRGESTSPQLVGLSNDWVDEFNSFDVVLAPVPPAPRSRTKPPPVTVDADPALTRAVVEEVVDEEVESPRLAGHGSEHAPVAEDIDEYDAIYGRTVARSVQSAAVSAIAEAPADLTIIPANDGDVRTASNGAPSARQEIDSPAQSTPLIQGVPGGDGQGTLPPLGDHDGRTMTKAQLKALRAAQGDAPVVGVQMATMGGPTVQALLCPSQHPNPPQLSNCRVCRAPLGLVPVTIARPTLGTLRFGEGTVVTLDRPALIGRNPKLEGAMPSEVTNMVRIDVGQGLSRTHASVKLEGWQVLLEDLNSANGTIVRLPGREPRRLHPGEPIMLEPGSQIDFGGEVECTVEP